MKRTCLFLTVLAFLFSVSVQADTLKGGEFLKLSESQQHWWYFGALQAITHMAYLHDEQKALCVWNWLPADTENKKALLQKSFAQYPDESPTSILIALLQRDCGDLMPIAR